MTLWEQIEAERLELQAMLDSQKSSEDRNRMGQFATPTALRARRRCTWRQPHPRRGASALP